MAREKENISDLENIQGSRGALDQAKEIFSVDIGEETVVLGYLLKVPLPKRVGGHDYVRGKLGGGQQGKGKSASDHAINQGNQWTRYKDAVTKALKKNPSSSTIQQKAKNILKTLNPPARKLSRKEKKEEKQKKVLSTAEIPSETPSITLSSKREKEKARDKERARDKEKGRGGR